MGTFKIIDHPLVQNKIAKLRSVHTGNKEFRELVEETTALICYEATRDIPLVEVDVETPICMAKTKVIDKKIALVPILRAGIGMVNGLINLIPTAKVGHIGMYRDPESLKPVEYFCKLPPDIAEREVLLLDPMLATGGTVSAAITYLKEKGCVNIKFLCLISCPEGRIRIEEDHPDVNVYTAAHDERLNELSYIVPGLGDAGDRLFGTK
ncbi:MAG: uracil phosphoribosyltransferase [Defluviitaleaceae bacterium]|nr:uracil phosphoribosyltransferase [Defluviitaleaceae bacterium]MCL2835387.1 uracil phosphoribosyltransferase [Defluviitaleaceae bacterium]